MHLQCSMKMGGALPKSCLWGSEVYLLVSKRDNGSDGWSDSR